MKGWEGVTAWALNIEPGYWAGIAWSVSQMTVRNNMADIEVHGRYRGGPTCWVEMTRDKTIGIMYLGKRTFRMLLDKYTITVASETRGREE